MITGKKAQEEVGGRGFFQYKTFVSTYCMSGEKTSPRGARYAFLHQNKGPFLPDQLFELWTLRYILLLCLNGIVSYIDTIH